MTIDITYKPEKSFLYILVKGQCSLEEYKVAMDEITHSEQFPANINAIWDVRDQDFRSITTDTVNSLIEISEQYPERKPAHVAFIAKDNLAYGMLRMYEMLSSIKEPDSSNNLRVFRTYSEGEKWLLGEEL